MPAKPRFHRRKEDRPSEITEAAFTEFARKGYAATRVNDVCKRAGVSKGLLYLYFKTKEDLFKSVIRNFVVPQVDALKVAIESSPLSAEAFLRGPFLKLMQSLVDSKAQTVIRLLIAEGPKHPDLTAYYCEHVITQGTDVMQKLIAKGVADGEFRPSPLQEFPQLLLGPVLLSVIWKSLFERHRSLDTDALIAAQLELLLTAIKPLPAQEAPA